MYFTPLVMATWLAERAAVGCVHKQILMYSCASDGTKRSNNALIVYHTQPASPHVNETLRSAGGARHVHQCK